MQATREWILLWDLMLAVFTCTVATFCVSLESLLKFNVLSVGYELYFKTHLVDSSIMEVHHLSCCIAFDEISAARYIFSIIDLQLPCGQYKKHITIQ